MAEVRFFIKLNEFDLTKEVNKFGYCQQIAILAMIFYYLNYKQSKRQINY
jgi:hypothetical protein